jgi:hypothetical protein
MVNCVKVLRYFTLSGLMDCLTNCFYNIISPSGFSFYECLARFLKIPKKKHDFRYRPFRAPGKTIAWFPWAAPTVNNLARFQRWHYSINYIDNCYHQLVGLRSIIITYYHFAYPLIFKSSHHHITTSSHYHIITLFLII